MNWTDNVWLSIEIPDNGQKLKTNDISHDLAMEILFLLWFSNLDLEGIKLLRSNEQSANENDLMYILLQS